MNKQVLVIGKNPSIMAYVNELRQNSNLNTYNSFTHKCLKYEINNLDKYTINKYNIIVLLDNTINDLLNDLILEDTQVSDIFTLCKLKIRNKKINIHNTLKILYINNIIKSITTKTEIQQPITTKTEIQQPIKKENNKSIINNDFYKFSELCLNMLPNLNDVTLKNIANNSLYESVFIEFRQLPHCECIIKNCVDKLDNSWSHTIVCGNDNYEHMLTIRDRLNKNIKIIKLDMSNVTQNDYNNLLLTKHFWNNFMGEKILIHQSDSFIFKSNISDFLEWDYIGAPFIVRHRLVLAKHQVGNGGLSLRSKSKMIEILDNVDLSTNVYSRGVNNYKKYKNLDNYPEDIVFSQNIQTLGIGKVPDYDTANKFASDSIYNDDNFGMHCMWNGCKNWEEIFKTMADKYDTNLENDKVLVKITSENDITLPLKITQNSIKQTKCLFFNSNMNEGGSVTFRSVLYDLLNIDEIIDINNKKQFEILINEININNLYLVLNNYLFNDFDNNYIVSIVSKYNLHLIIPIHDFYWFNFPYYRKYDYLEKNMHGYYLDTSLNHVENIVLPKQSIQLFNKGTLICPSIFIFDILKKSLKNTNTNINILQKYWTNETINTLPIKIKIHEMNVGFLVSPSNYKGIEQLMYLKNNVLTFKKYSINYFIVSKNIPKYEDNYEAFNSIIKKYNISCLLLLNKYGETFCFSLNKYLKTSLPIFYNNVGSFIERIPKTNSNFIINNINENEFYNYELLTSNFNYFLRYVDAVINDKIFDNIFIITSKIIVSTNKFSYSNTRSIYSTETRFKDTLYTIQTIKKFYPTAIILLIDDSLFDYKMTYELKKHVDIFLDNVIVNNIYNIYYNTNINTCKGTAEMSMIYVALKFITDKNIKCKNIFKISGRYFLNDNHNAHIFDNEYIIFKKNKILEEIGKSNKYYYCCFYKIPFKFIDTYLQITYKYVINNQSVILTNNLLGLEESLIQDLQTKISIDNFMFVDELGLTQNLSLTTTENYNSYYTTKYI